MQVEENEKFSNDLNERLASSNGERISTGECDNGLNVRDDGNAKDEAMSMQGNGLEFEEEAPPRVYSPPLPFPPRVYTKTEEKKDTIRSMDVPQVEHVVNTTNVIWNLPSVVEPLEKLQPLMYEPHIEYILFKHHLRSVVEPLEKLQPLKDVPQEENVLPTYHIPSVFEVMEELQPSKNAKRKRRKRRKKKKKTKEKGIVPKPLLLTFTPLRFVDGKLECKVSSKGGHKPFSKVRILLSPDSKGDDWSAINESMVKTFSMKLGDRGPILKPKVPNG